MMATALCLWLPWVWPVTKIWPVKYKGNSLHSDRRQTCRQGVISSHPKPILPSHVYNFQLNCENVMLETLTPKRGWAWGERLAGWEELGGRKGRFTDILETHLLQASGFPKLLNQMFNPVLQMECLCLSPYLHHLYVEAVTIKLVLRYLEMRPLGGD